MNEIQIVEAPIEEGVSVKEVRGTLAAKFPEFRIAGLIEDKAEGLWRARLVKSGEFPLKELGDEEETVDDAGADDVDDEEAPKKAPKPPSDDEDPDKEEEPDDEAGDSEEKGNPKGKAEHIIKQLEHLLPQLEELLGVGRGGDVGDLGDDLGDAGPHMEGPPGHDTPMPEGVAPNGAGPSMQPGAPVAPPRRPPGAGGGGGRMRPGQIPTFTKRRSQLLEREANVSMNEAKAELEAEFPEYAVTELKKHRNRFLAKLELRSTT